MARSEFQHGLYYPDAHNVSLSDIAATLIAHEKLLPIISEILERSLPGLSVQYSTISLDKIERSSLLEHFFVAIFIVFQKELQEEVPDAITAITGIQVSDRYDTLVTVLFLLVLYYGAARLLGKKEKGASPVPASIEGGYEEYLSRTAKQLGVTERAVEAAINESVGPRRLPTVMRSAVDLIRPAKRGGNGRIAPLGLPEIPASTIADFPSDIALAEIGDDTVPLPFNDATLRLRAIDKDKSDRGWAGILEADGIKTKRLPVRLYPTIDREALAKMDTAHVEALLESKIDDEGRTTPKRIHILRLTALDVSDAETKKAQRGL